MLGVWLVKLKLEPVYVAKTKKGMFSCDNACMTNWLAITYWQLLHSNVFSQIQSTMKCVHIIWQQTKWKVLKEASVVNLIPVLSLAKLVHWSLSLVRLYLSLVLQSTKFVARVISADFIGEAQTRY